MVKGKGINYLTPLVVRDEEPILQRQQALECWWWSDDVLTQGGVISHQGTHHFAKWHVGGCGNCTAYSSEGIILPSSDALLTLSFPLELKKLSLKPPDSVTVSFRSVF
jgi:hypothetical protein